MEMDIGANLTTINHKSCTLSHNFLRNRKISYKETFDKNLFQSTVLHSKTGEMKLAW